MSTPFEFLPGDSKSSQLPASFSSFVLNALRESAASETTEVWNWIDIHHSSYEYVFNENDEKKYKKIYLC